MRSKCECGKIAGYWYAPAIYKRMTYEEHINAHALCEDHADTDNWAEYEWIGYHKKDWQWLRKKNVLKNLEKWNNWLSKPYYRVSHVKDGVRWHLQIARSLEEAKRTSEDLDFVEIKEEHYPSTEAYFNSL